MGRVDRTTNRSIQRRRREGKDAMGSCGEEWIARLEREYEEYRRLWSRHHGFDQKLRALSSKRLLTEQEKMEEVRMKKEKLFLKDRMAAIEREFDSPGA